MRLKNNRAGLSFLMLALLSVVLVFSCQKERSIDTGIPVPETSNIVSTSVQGKVVDENQHAVQGAIVRIGINSTLTDAQGSFLLEHVTANADAATVHVEKTGYFEGSRTFMAKAQQLQFVQVELLPKKVAGLFQASKGGTVNGSSCDLVFAANTIRKADGTVYSGNVNVSYAFLNPESDRFRDFMPGDLKGINTSGEEVGLKSFGMFAVELEGAGGEKLRLDSSKPVTLKLTIPASLRTSAPATIPLWYFNEETGLWKEEGSAKKDGNFYTGTVKHFSFWNCDAPFPLVDIQGTVQDASGNPLANGKVQLQSKTGDLTSYGYLDGNGNMRGSIPSGVQLEMTVYAPAPCNAELYKVNIGPYSQAADLGTIKVSIPSNFSVKISGAAKDCADKAVAAGFVRMTMNGIRYTTPIKNGAYAISLISCATTGTTLAISAYDSSTSKYANSSLTLAASNAAVVHNVVACDNVAAVEELKLTLDGQQINFIADIDSVKNVTYRDTVMVYGMRKPGTQESLSLDLRDDNTSTTTTASLYYMDAAGKGYSARTSLQITKRDNLVLEGTMSGNLTPSNFQGTKPTYPFSFSFRIFK